MHLHMYHTGYTKKIYNQVTVFPNLFGIKGIVVVVTMLPTKVLTSLSLQACIMTPTLFENSKMKDPHTTI
jgi:hypothetical protein